MFATVPGAIFHGRMCARRFRLCGERVFKVSGPVWGPPQGGARELKVVNLPGLFTVRDLRKQAVVPNAVFGSRVFCPPRAPLQPKGFVGWPTAPSDKPDVGLFTLPMCQQAAVAPQKRGLEVTGRTKQGLRCRAQLAKGPPKPSDVPSNRCGHLMNGHQTRAASVAFAKVKPPRVEANARPEHGAFCRRPKTDARWHPYSFLYSGGTILSEAQSKQGLQEGRPALQSPSKK